MAKPREDTSSLSADPESAREVFELPRTDGPSLKALNLLRCYADAPGLRETPCGATRIMGRQRMRSGLPDDLELRKCSVTKPGTRCSRLFQ